MGDEHVRQLERAGERGKLEREWLRRGLGWYGEALPQNDAGYLNAITDELPEKVYSWRVHNTHGDDLLVDLVYVPRGEMECRACRGTGDAATVTHERDWQKCVECNGTGVCTIAPFYAGRFPVIVREWMVHIGHPTYGDPNRLAHLGKFNTDSNANNPVADVSLDAVREFCGWAGLRLLSEREWEWAALGAPVPCTNCGGGRHGVNGGCVECNRTGRRLRRFPWSKPEDHIRENGPSPDRCVWAGHPEFGPTPAAQGVITLRLGQTVRRGDFLSVRPDGAIGPARPDQAVVGHAIHDAASGMDAQVSVRGIGRRGSTAPVMVPIKPGAPISYATHYVPARPAGASWCGAHDMAGNVWEWTSYSDGRGGGSCLGGSFRDDDMAMASCFAPHYYRHEAAYDNVGFRVALSVV